MSNHHSQRCMAGLILLMIALVSAAPSSTPSEERPPLDQSQLESLNSLDLEEEKRAWSNLHGGWGKRGWNDMSSAWGKRGWNDMSSAWGKRAWNNLHGGWGKRGWNDMNSAWGKRAWNNLHGGWGKRAWNNLHGGWGKRDTADLMDFLEAVDQQGYEDEPQNLETMEQFEPVGQDAYFNGRQLLSKPEGLDDSMDKRTWSSLHGTWGKRSEPFPKNGDKWSNFRGSWGKREPGWNNLKGLWGKRSVNSKEEIQTGGADRRDE